MVIIVTMALHLGVIPSLDRCWRAYLSKSYDPYSMTASEFINEMSIWNQNCYEPIFSYKIKAPKTGFFCIIINGRIQIT